MESVWIAQIRKGVLELCVLALVAREETYGYAVVERLGAMPGLEVTESTVYPLLARMAGQGLLKVRTAKSDSGPPRRYYSQSALGKQRLAELAGTWKVVSQTVTSLLASAERDLTTAKH